LERYGRYLGIERNGFAVLIEPSAGQFQVFGQAGYLIGDGIGMLVERGDGPAFVWHRESVKATPELLGGYERFRTEVERLLRKE
jgi:hypothetical protein